MTANISTNSGPSTTIEVVQSTRRMQFLTVQESELENITHYNTEITTFWSIASSSFSVFLTLFFSALFSAKDGMSDYAKATCWVGMPLTIAIGIAALWLVYNANKTKKSSIQRIKSESKAGNQT